LHVVLDYPQADEELRILDQDLQRNATDPEPGAARGNAPAMDAAAVLEARQAVRRIHLAPVLRHYIVELVRATRNPGAQVPRLQGMVEAGASPRAVLALAHAAQALAYLRGRDFVLPDDIIELAPDVLRHRIVLALEADLQGQSRDDLIAALLQAIPVP
ncbi:MAG: AAA family ATPase, partial [Thiomonas delicata]